MVSIAYLPLVLGASTRKELGRFRLTWDADVIIGLPGVDREAKWGLSVAGSLVTYSVPAGTTVYAHVTEVGDQLPISTYHLDIDFP